MVIASIPYIHWYLAALTIHTRTASIKAPFLPRLGLSHISSSTGMVGGIPGAGGLALVMDSGGLDASCF